MKLSIAICTYDRPRELEACLRAIRKLGYARSHEVLVVDNSDRAEARTANAREVRATPGTRYVHSEPPGLSRARNRALQEATGDVIAYLDDDATCLEGWAESLLEAFAAADVVCAGGPVLPRWESPRPAWLDGELLAALSLSDHGREAHDLPEGEFIHGANCAFRTDVLREVGGFDTELGRTRAELLGDEEIDVQRRLRARGRTRYAPGARVLHLVPAERCTLEWFLRRYAWQGVSDARSADPGTLGYLGTLLDPEELPSARALLADLFGRQPASARDAVARVAFVRGLVGALLHDAVPLPGLPRRVPAAARERTLEAPEFAPFKLHVPGETRYLFLELGVSHSSLYDVYGGIPGAFLLTAPIDPGAEPRAAVAFLRDAIFFASQAGIEAVVLVSADVLTWAGYDHALEGRARPPAVYGLLHRLPRDAAAAERLRSVARHLDGWFVFADELRDRLRDEHGLDRIHVVPHPPLFFANGAPRPRRARRPGEGRIGVGLLGEVRPGKGYELAVEALAGAPPPVRDRIELVMAGAAHEAVIRSIERTCVEAGLATRLDLRPRSVRGYRAIPDGVFAVSLAACDVVAFPYEGDHLQVFSGHFVDALVAGAIPVASRGSLLGGIVERHDVGETFEVGDRASFVAALERALVRVDGGRDGGPGRQRLLAAHAAASARRAIELVLRGEDASRDDARQPSPRRVSTSR